MLGKKYPPKVGALMMGIYHDRILKKSPTKQTKKEGILNYFKFWIPTKKMFQIPRPNLAFFLCCETMAPSESPRSRRAEADLAFRIDEG